MKSRREKAILDRNEKIVVLYKTGWPITSIGLRYGLKATEVYDIIANEVREIIVKKR